MFENFFGGNNKAEQPSHHSEKPFTEETPEMTPEAAEDAGLNKSRDSEEIENVLVEEGVKDESEDLNDDTPMAA